MTARKFKYILIFSVALCATLGGVFVRIGPEWVAAVFIAAAVGMFGPMITAVAHA